MQGESWKELVDHPLLKLAGGTLTPGSLALASAILAGAVMLARAMSAGTRSLLQGRGLSAGSQFAIGKIVRYGIWILGLAIALSSMGIRLDALFAASAVLAVGIGFGLQNIAQNFISGIILLIEQPVRTGDFVRVGTAFGVVEDIGLRATRIVTRDAVTIIVPNSQFITESVVNHSRPTLNLRIQVAVGVAYGTDPERLRSTLIDASRAVPQVLQDPPPLVRFDDFGDSSLNFKLLAWISNPRDDLQVASDLRFAMERALREAKIEIPFPQRDLHLKSGFEVLGTMSRPDKVD